MVVIASYILSLFYPTTYLLNFHFFHFLHFFLHFFYISRQFTVTYYHYSSQPLISWIYIAFKLNINLHYHHGQHDFFRLEFVTFFKLWRMFRSLSLLSNFDACLGVLFTLYYLILLVSLVHHVCRTPGNYLLDPSSEVKYPNPTSEYKLFWHSITLDCTKFSDAT